MPLNVYLNFNGNCREVFDFYRSVFGGEFSMHLTFHELPEDMGMAGEELNQILHVSYDIGGTTLMG
ncbi:MAG: VOC family protein, partial [Chloroflexota bacterium]|nr:VOC family protein [Chloroflexota bacterium]